jgi:hypothetical protein
LAATPDGLAFHTPDYDGNAPLICRRVALPSFYWKYLNGVLDELANEENWLMVGDITPSEAAQFFAEAIDEMYEGNCMPVGTIYQTLCWPVPENTLVCMGQQVSVADYPELASVVYSGLISDGMIQLPNYRGRVLSGAAFQSQIGQEVVIEAQSGTGVSISSAKAMTVIVVR